MGYVLDKDALTRHRLLQNMKKGEMAAALGRAPSYVSDLESGRKKNPSPALLADLASVLGCRVEDLLIKDEAATPFVPPVRRENKDRLVGTPIEVAEAMGVSLGTVHELIRAGRLPHVKYGRRRVGIPWAALFRWLEDEANRNIKEA